MSNSSRPFAPGSISMRLYPHNELEAEQVVAELVGQAQAALTNGFDGVMTSEHHGGSPGYLPNPLQVTGFQLEATESGWAAPCPLLLPLRPTALVAEEVAWLDARHPGRVGLGVASGALPLDFEAMDVPLEERSQRFAAELPRIVDMLRGKDLRGLDGDPALRRLADNPIPVLSAAVSSVACRRAALCDAGILLEGMSSPDKLTRFCQVFDEAGGTGAKVLIRRVWIGPPNTELIERQRAFYASFSDSPRPMGTDQTLSTLDPAEMAGSLHDLMVQTGADAMNLRVHLPGIPATAAREQIVRLGEEVVPLLRALIAGVGPMTGRFDGKVAVVSGSSKDPSIGRAIATRLAREGASVVINGRDEAIVADAEAAMRAEGLAVASVPGTMGDPGVAAAMVHAAHGHFGRLDLLVNTVGGTRYNGPPLEMSRANLLDTVELNAWTSLEMLQEAMRAGLADDGGGSVVFISSGTVNKTTASMASYAAGKSALNALTRTLAKEVGPLGVRLNGVAPGLTKTSATRGMWEADDGASAGSNLLLGRLTEADDIAAAAVFLLSPEAKAITGVVIDVDGGNHLQSGGWSPMAPKAAG